MRLPPCRTPPHTHGALLVTLAVLLLAALFDTTLAADAAPGFVHQRIYRDLDGYACVRLIGPRGPIGCSTGAAGKYGWLYPLQEQEELARFLASPPAGPVVAVLAPHLFFTENVERLSLVDAVQGLLILHAPNPTRGRPFSPESAQPNQEFSLYPNSTIKWNPHGTGWMYNSFKLPMFALDAKNSPDVLEAALANVQSKSFPKWAVRLTAWMHSPDDADSLTCLRRGLCEPLGGKNIWNSLKAVDAQRRIVMAVATFDSSAFFHDLAFGANADASGLVALLGAIEALAKVDLAQLKRQIIFAIFTAESWGYIGSRSFVKDISNFLCYSVPRSDPSRCNEPLRTSTAFQQLKLDMIDSIVNVEQVGQSSSAAVPELFIHQDPTVKNASDIVHAITLSASLSGIKASTISDQTEIPPSSLMSFFRKTKDISGIVLSDYAREYTNKFYHSQYDDASNVNMSAICAASNTLARSLYLLALDDQSAVTASQINEIAVDCDTVAQFFHCLVVDTNCTLFHKFSGSSSSKVDLPPPSRYTSVYSRHRVALLSKFIYDWISYQTSPFRSIKKCDDHSQCKDKRAPACLAGVCVAPGYSFFHDAYSPAFELIGGEWRIVDKTESLWTESYWSTPFMEMFQMSDPWFDYGFLLAGVVELCACLLWAAVLRTFVVQHLKL